MASSRVNEIDLLRFLAALAVVIFHYSFRGYTADDMSIMPYPLLAPFAKYGHLGVELFFMISGFVILMTAASGGLRSFVVSRIVRLYPAFWACCTVTFILTVAIGGPRFSASIGQYLLNMTMLSGFFGIPSIDGAYWSLFVELKFYALVATVLIFKGIHRAQVFLVLWLIATVALELIPIGKLRFLLIADYSAYFIAGAMSFLIWSRGLSPVRAGVIVVSWVLALHQSISGIPNLEKHYDTSMNRYVVAGIVTAFFLAVFLVAVRRTGFLGRKSWLTIGALTYPLYLIHQYIGFMIFNVAYPTVNEHLLLWGTVIFMLGAAYAIHMLIERRFALPIKRYVNQLLSSLERLTPLPRMRRLSGETVPHKFKS